MAMRMAMLGRSCCPTSTTSPSVATMARGSTVALRVVDARRHSSSLFTLSVCDALLALGLLLEGGEVRVRRVRGANCDIDAMKGMVAHNPNAPAPVRSDTDAH